MRTFVPDRTCWSLLLTALAIILAIKVGTVTFDLFKDYGQFTETELKAHVLAYLTGTNHCAGPDLT